VTRRLRAASALAAWLAFVLGVLVVLHAMGGRLAPPPLSGLEDARAWLEQRPPADVVFAVLRLLALALGWYLLAVTIASVVARLLRLAAVVTVVDVVTVPSVRRLVNAAVGLSVVATGYPGLAAAAESAPPAVEIMRRLPDDAPDAPGALAPPGPASVPTTITMHRLPDEPGDELPASPSPQPTPSTAPAPAPTPAPSSPPRSTQVTAVAPKVTTREPSPRAAAPTPPTAPPTPPALGPVPGSWTVRSGDHFWAVAEQVLSRAWGRPPTDAEVARYWRTLVETNRSRLPDPANPDLLFPGHSLTVPPPPARPA